MSFYNIFFQYTLQHTPSTHPPPPPPYHSLSKSNYFQRITSNPPLLPPPYTPLPLPPPTIHFRNLPLPPLPPPLTPLYFHPPTPPSLLPPLQNIKYYSLEDRHQWAFDTTPRGLSSTGIYKLGKTY